MLPQNGREMTQVGFEESLISISGLSHTKVPYIRVSVTSAACRPVLAKKWPYTPEIWLSQGWTALQGK